VLAVLAGTASPHGGERPLASSFAAWAAERWPGVDWAVRPLDETSASVLATTGEGPADLVIYSHLDTSLTGSPATDAAITGRDDPLPEFRFDPASGTVSGFGLGVAKAPAAAAIVGFVRAASRLPERARVHLLLAARGTHRTDWASDHVTGVTEYLSAFGPPGAAVVAKGGPPGVLRQEPAALYLRIRLEGGWGPLMTPGGLRPPGGPLAQASGLLSAIDAWGSVLLTDATSQALRADPSRQDGAAFGLGAIRAGEPGKSDLAPARLEVFAYVVLPGPITPGATADSLSSFLRDRFEGMTLQVEERLLGNAPGTPADAPVVRAATEAWAAELGTEPEPITGWTGSTDGVVFRAAGVATARLGPRPFPGPDPRVDSFDLTQLSRYAAVYERLICALFTSECDPPSHLT
jgi:hypothetical protein